MKARKKLDIVFYIIIFFVLSIFFYPILKENLIGGLIYLSVIAILILLRKTFFKNNYVNLNLIDSDASAIGYTIGGMILFLAIIILFGIGSTIIKGDQIPLWLLIGFVITGILGILEIYYSYQTKKEFSQIKKLKEKPKKTIIDKKQKRFWIIYLLTFVIIAVLLRYLFKLTEFTLINVIIHTILIILLYFFLRIILSKMK